jgi:hypothetical protein
MESKNVQLLVSLLISTFTLLFWGCGNNNPSDSRNSLEVVSTRASTCIDNVRDIEPILAEVTIRNNGNKSANNVSVLVTVNGTFETDCANYSVSAITIIDFDIIEASSTKSESSGCFFDVQTPCRPSTFTARLQAKATIL